MSRVKAQIKSIILASNIILAISTFTNVNDFPISEFFDLEQNSADEISAYLCNDPRTRTKCCSCTATLTANWCIDIFWLHKPFRNMSSYLIYLSNEYDERAFKNQYKRCEPIISPISDQHFVEHRMMYSTYNENGRFKECSNERIANNVFENKPFFRTPVFHEISKETYIDEECGRINNPSEFGAFWVPGLKTKDDLNLIQLFAKCENVTNVYLGMSIKKETFKHLSKCYFSLELKDEKDVSLLAPKCPSGKGSRCPITDLNYMLCNAYYAPMNGFRNYHCAKCDNQFSISKKVKKCIYKDHCKKGICDFQSSKFTQELKYSRGLYLDFNNSIVSGFRYPFPIDDFFKAYRFDYPRRTSSCCWKKKSYCSKFKHCCVDYYWNFSIPIPIENYQQILIDKTKHFKDHSCEKLAPHEVETRYTTFYYMITSCLENATLNQKQKCANVNGDDLKSYFPVIGNDDYLYRNLYCAQCNFVNSYAHVKIGLDCRFSKCRAFINTKRDSKDSIVQLCDNEMSSNTSCPQGHPFHDLCKAFVGPTEKYRNIFCHLCNFPDKKATFQGYCKGTKIFFTWSMLINLSDDSKHQKITYAGDINCVIMKTIHLFLFKECNTIRCLKGSIPLIKSCKDYLLSLKRPIFDTCFNASNEMVLFIIEKRVQGNNTFNHSSEILDILKIKNNETIKYYENSTHEIIKITQDVDVDILSLIEIEYDLLLPHMINNNISLLLTQTKSPLLGTIHSFDFYNNFPHFTYCYGTKHLDVSKVNFSTSCGTIIDNKVINFSDISFQARIDRTGIKRILQYCTHRYLSLSCETTLLKNDILLNQKDGTLIHSNFKEKNVYSVSHYYPTREGAFVCQKSSLRWIPVIKTIDVYVSMIGSFMSMVCYVVIIYTYRSTQRLWNTPGKLIVSLCSSFLISDFMFILAWILHVTHFNRIWQFCKTVGVVMHLASLLAYNINVMISYDMMLRFTTTSILENGRTVKIPLMLSVLLSCFFIALALIFDYLDIVVTGYGKSGICLPHEFLGRLYFYILPLAVSFVITFIFLVRVLWVIKKEKQMIKSHLRNNQREKTGMMKLAVKLTLILGLIESVGFIQIIQVNNIVFSMVISLLYTLVRSLRGFLLFLVFTCCKNACSTGKTKEENTDVSA